MTETTIQKLSVKQGDIVIITGTISGKEIHEISDRIAQSGCGNVPMVVLPDGCTINTVNHKDLADSGLMLKFKPGVV